MAIDVDTEHLIHFAAAGREFPGRAKHIATMHRYRLHGVRRVKLETILIGGLRYTSKEAISRFIAAQNADDNHTPAISPAQRAMQSAAARRELESMGV